jgi:hypothetical protein
VKPLSILIITAILYGKTALAQQTEQGLILRAGIVSIKEDTSYGYIKTLTDSTLAFATERKILSKGKANADQYKIVPYYEIKEIYIRKKGSAGKGIGIGAASGAILGAIIGAASYKEPDPNQYHVLDDKGTATISGAFIGAIGGVLVGALVGNASRKKFVIDGNKVAFQTMQKKVKLY